MNQQAVAWYQAMADAHGWGCKAHIYAEDACRAYRCAREAAHYAALVIEDRERTIDAPISPAYLAETCPRWLV